MSRRPSVSILLPWASFLTAATICFATITPAPGEEYHSFHPGRPWLDTEGRPINAHGGGVLFHEGVYYWYGEKRGSWRQRDWPSSQGVNLYRSNDLYNWEFVSTVLRPSADPESQIRTGCLFERPKIVFNKRTGKFVMWFHLELAGQGYNAARAGVAVADSIEGPFDFVDGFRPNAGQLPRNLDPQEAEAFRLLQDGETPTAALREAIPRFEHLEKFAHDFPGGQMSRDQTVFIDDDSNAYQVRSSEENRTLHVSLLSPDYLRPSGDFARVAVGGANEAPAVLKRDGVYHMITSGLTGWRPNKARYHTATDMFGPWQQHPNPLEGTNPVLNLGADKTFGGQSSFILKLPDRPDAYVAMFDVWKPRDLQNSGHIWLPITFDPSGRMQIPWRDEWDLSVFPL